MDYGAACYDSTGKTCSGIAQPGTIALRDVVLAIFTELASWGIYNCLSRETRVLTRDGWIPIGDLAGTEVEILTTSQSGAGHWVTAPIRSFGTQRLMRVTIVRAGRTRVLFATPEHRWFVRQPFTGAKRKEVLTVDLQRGQRLETIRPQSVATRTSPSPIGVQAGLVFGDGTAASHDARLMLCGEKDVQLIEWMSGLQPMRPYEDGLLVTGFPKSFKTLPSLDEGTSYLYGWLAGYFAADGSVKLSGTPTLYSANPEHLEFVRVLALRLGIVTGEVVGRKRHGYGDEPSMLYDLRLDPRTLDSDFFLIPSHRERWNSAARQRPTMWRVESVEMTEIEEEVFCAVVGGTESFAIDEFILTGNCRPTRGGGSLSTHGEGRGWDCRCNAFNAAQKKAGDTLAALLVKHARKLGIQRIIWNRRQTDVRGGMGTWRAYGGTSPHTDHLHIELCWQAARGPKRLTTEYVWMVLKEEEEMTPEQEKKLDEALKEMAALRAQSAAIWKALYKKHLRADGTKYDAEHLNLLDDKLDILRSEVEQRLIRIEEKLDAP